MTISFFDLCTVVAFMIYGLRLREFQKQVSMHAKLQRSLRTVCASSTGNSRGQGGQDWEEPKQKSITHKVYSFHEALQ